MSERSAACARLITTAGPIPQADGASDAPRSPRNRGDRELKRLIAELTSHSPRFAELWESGQVDSPQDQSRHKIIDHPDVGLITLDCDTLIVAGNDLRITVYTAEPGTQDAERLALAIVLGTQAHAYPAHAPYR
jgi:hypothetical protein